MNIEIINVNMVKKDYDNLITFLKIMNFNYTETTTEEIKEHAKKWYRQGVMDTVKDVNPEGIDNDFEMLYGNQFKYFNVDSFKDEEDEIYGKADPTNISKQPDQTSYPYSRPKRL